MWALNPMTCALIRRGRSGDAETYREKGSLQKEAEIVVTLLPAKNTKESQQPPG